MKENFDNATKLKEKLRFIAKECDDDSTHMSITLINSKNIGCCLLYGTLTSCTIALYAAMQEDKNFANVIIAAAAKYIDDNNTKITNNNKERYN